MSKKSIIIIILALLSLGIISLYTTFAYNEEISTLEESNADYNLIYSLKEKSNKYISIASKEEKHLDIYLQNTYDSTIKYGMYYKLINPNKMPDNISISLAPESKDLLENIIKAGESRTISIIISNNSEYNIDLVIGASVGFENGNIEDLLKNGEILIK